jgi:hypothetical protein
MFTFAIVVSIRSSLHGWSFMTLEVVASDLIVSCFAVARTSSNSRFEMNQVVGGCRVVLISGVYGLRLLGATVQSEEW